MIGEALCIIKRLPDDTITYEIGEGDWVRVSVPVLSNLLDELNKFRQLKAALK